MSKFINFRLTASFAVHFFFSSVQGTQHWGLLKSNLQRKLVLSINQPITVCSNVCFLESLPSSKLEIDVFWALSETRHIFLSSSVFVTEFVAGQKCRVKRKARKALTSHC
jgi:hypothetical protein